MYELNPYSANHIIMIMPNKISMSFSPFPGLLRVNKHACKGYWKDFFIRKEELEYDPYRQVQYLRDDTLRFRVIDVTEWN